jgi:hypothetical protein
VHVSISQCPPLADRRQTTVLLRTANSQQHGLLTGQLKEVMQRETSKIFL